MYLHKLKLYSEGNCYYLLLNIDFAHAFHAIKVLKVDDREIER